MEKDIHKKELEAINFHIDKLQEVSRMKFHFNNGELIKKQLHEAVLMRSELMERMKKSKGD
jgi:hypothetical protein